MKSITIVSILNLLLGMKNKLAELAINRRKFLMSISGVILMILGIAIFAIAFVDCDKGRIKSSSFVECNVSKNVMKCETFISADEIVSITKIHGTMLSLGWGAGPYMETPIGMIYEPIVQYEALVHGTIPTTAYVNIDRISNNSRYFAVIDDKIEYKWYFKSRLGTLYRMFSPKNPYIVKAPARAYGAISPTIFIAGLCLLLYRWLY